jgi:uncharacterized repeat protein (TIGR03803 family)
MQSQEQPQVTLFRAIVLAGVIAFLMTSLPLTAQNSSSQKSVPSNARQAAAMPQFAAKLAHGASRISQPVKPRASYKRPANTFAPAKRNWMGGENELYDNGPINGTTDAWTINSGFAVSNTITIPGGANNLTGMTFGAWLLPGDVLESVEISITSSPLGGTTYFDSVVFTSQNNCETNQFGYNICIATATFDGPFLSPQTYWVTLSNAVVNDGDPVYWDENSGVGCEASGCPSDATDSGVGTIPSESFTIQGDSCTDQPATAAKTVPSPPSPAPTYRVIYNFTGGEDGGGPDAGLVLDAAGNLYGTTGRGGPGGGGTVFKLSSNPSGSWRFTRLYSFSGANGAGPSSTLLRAADGRLFGSTYGGGLGFGTLFGLVPDANIPPTVFSNWMETLLYDFTAGSDGVNPGGPMALDSSGNIYANAFLGGANQQGTLVEYTNGGLQVLHAFPSFSGDGEAPIGVVNTSNGLYGITRRGGANRGGTLYTTAGGYQVLHSFLPTYPEGTPGSLTADQAGNLYGGFSYSTNCGFANQSVFQVSPPSWSPVSLASIGSSPGASVYVSTDTLGNIYGTTDFGGQSGQGSVFKLTCCWNFTELHDFSGYPSDGDGPVASPVVDAHGNIFGTTLNGGSNFAGVVWEISP